MFRETPDAAARKSQHRRECTEAEANVILGAGLALMVVQHVAPRSGYRRKRL